MNDVENRALVGLLVEQLAPIIQAAVREATMVALAGQAPKPARRLLTAKEVAAQLGYRSAETVRRLHRKGKLVANESLGKLRFREEDVAALLASGADRIDDGDEAGAE